MKKFFALLILATSVVTAQTTQTRDQQVQAKAKQELVRLLAAGAGKTAPQAVEVRLGQAEERLDNVETAVLLLATVVAAQKNQVPVAMPAAQPQPQVVTAPTQQTWQPPQVANPPVQNLPPGWVQCAPGAKCWCQVGSAGCPADSVAPTQTTINRIPGPVGPPANETQQAFARLQTQISGLSNQVGELNQRVTGVQQQNGQSQDAFYKALGIIAGQTVANTRDKKARCQAVKDLLATGAVDIPNPQAAGCK